MGFHKQRGEARTAIAVTARLRLRDRECEAFLANASSRGVMAIVATPPRRGTRIELQIGDELLTGRIRWAAAGRCGIALNETIRVSVLARGMEPGTSLVLSRDNGRRPGLVGALAGEQPWQRVGLILIFAAAAGTFLAISRLGHRGDREAPGVASASVRMP
ncbi:MAG TPA: PilZ domain-containing protein [Novosphingobium sp.]|nr:PilZ domain-containing protein [Novosphingobium sp.]